MIVNLCAKLERDKQLRYRTYQLINSVYREDSLINCDCLDVKKNIYYDKILYIG